ncbi:MAG TPA: hypothetical protein VEI83_01365 [Acidimicrobiales bacterium]|nr:hypothetical protein [Acidimicrobiales bacterium]
MDNVEDLLMEARPSVLGRHLAWLVDQSHAVPQVSPRRTLIEDQAGILIDALDRRDCYAVVARAIREPWVDEPGEVDDDVASYAGRLGMCIVGQPEYSPYVALARSAAKLAASTMRAAEEGARVAS